jgi:hypothetical protein
MLRLDNLRPSRALSWKVEDHQLGRSGSVMWKVDTSKVVAPRLCQLRTNGLASVSKYWTYWSHAGDMGLVSLVACCRQVLGLSALLWWLCWKRNWGESRGPLSRAERWSREHFFLRAMHPSNPIDDLWKVAICEPREIRMVEGHTQTKREKCVVWSGFLCRVYIDLNRRASRIWVTDCLWQSSHN